MHGNLFIVTLVLCVAYANCDALCQNQPQGSFVANPSNCSQYFKCVNETGVLKQCPNDYLWKDEKKWCDYPYNVDCGDRYNPHPPPQSICTGLDGVLLPDYEDCSKYYQCANGYILHKKCQSNYLWNDIMKWCDYPQNVICATRPPTEGTHPTTGTPTPTHPSPTNPSPTNPPTTQPPVTGTPPTTSKPGTCSVEGETYPDPTDCSNFYQCVGGREIKMKCPGGLHFSPTAHVCDYPENAGCQVN